MERMYFGRQVLFARLDTSKFQVEKAKSYAYADLDYIFSFADFAQVHKKYLVSTIPLYISG